MSTLNTNSRAKATAHSNAGQRLRVYGFVLWVITLIGYTALFLVLVSHAHADTVEHMITVEANRQHFPARIAIAVALVESSLKQSARGSHGEIGLFQLMPYHANGGNLADIHYNIKRGIEVLKAAQTACADMGKYYIICFNNGTNRRPHYPNLHPYYLRVAEAIR